MDIAQLTRFVAVAERGSFRLAAEALGVSQPSISWSIQQLEGTLGAALIERGARGAKLTELGEVLLPRAKLVISETERALADFNEYRRGRDASVRVGVSSLFINDVLPRASAALLKRFPDAVLNVVEGYSADLMSALQAGDIDLALCGFPASADASGLTFESICSQSYILAARSGHPLFAAGPASEGDVFGFPWVMFGRANFARPRHLSPFESRTPHVPARSGSMHYIRSMVLHSDLIGYVPREFVAGDLAAGRIREIASDVMAFSGPAGIIERANSAQTRLIRALKSEIRSACTDTRLTAAAIEAAEV